MKGTFPIITCDDDSGCTEWTLDWYEALASNWRELMAPGWSYDPHRSDAPQLCPDHAPVCGSRGPRIGSEGQPICRKPAGHRDRDHAPAPDDGWPAGTTWRDL